MIKLNLNEKNAILLKNLSGVYKITNITTGEFYIGSSKNLQNRYGHWRSEFKNKKNNNYSWLWENNNKLEDFQFEVLKIVDPIKDILREKEQYYFDTLNPTLNKSTNSKGNSNPIIYKGKEHPVYGKPSHKRRPIIQMDLEDNIINEWNYIMQVTDKLGYDNRSIQRVLKGEYKTAYGYKWKYK